MEDFYELIDTMSETRKSTGIKFSIKERSSIASGDIEFSINALGATYDMTNCREAIGFLEGFQAYHMLKQIS